MPIAAELPETIITAILQALNACHPRALSAKMLLIPLNHSGLAELSEQEIEGLLLDLSERRNGQGYAAPWVEPVESGAAAEVVRYRRTEAARVWLVKSAFRS